MKLDKILQPLLLLLFILISLSSHAQQPPGVSTGTIKLPEPPTPVKMDSNGSEEIKTESKKEEAGPEMVYLNVQEQDIKDVIRQISKATHKNFIIDDKVRGKITILSEKMMTKEEAYQAFLSALEVAGYTVVTGPAGIIKIVSLKDALGSPIPIHVDSTPYTDSFVTRLISLTNISAVDMSNAIKPLISKSGNLFAYPATNTIIITDSGTNIDRLMKIIKELDQEGPQQVVEIIPIRYAEAEQVASTVLNLFELEKSSARTARRTTRGKQASSAEEIKDVSKIIADTRTNSVIVMASKRSISKIKEIIRKLDTSLTEASGTIHVHYLKYANAEEMAATLSSVTPSSSAAKGKAGEASSAVANFEGGMTVGADKTTNSLIITASTKDYKMLVDSLISKLDVPRRQVYLESIIMELTITKGRQLSAEGYMGGIAGGMMAFGQTMGGISRIFQPDSLFQMSGLLGGVLGGDQINIDVPVTGGGTQTVTIPAFAAFLNFISSYSNANVVSTPNILTIDNEEASIDVKQKEYAQSTTTTATGFSQTTPIPLEAGLTLKITPQISEGNAVRLKIEHELSNFLAASAGAIARPSRSRKISTTVMAMDGQTVVLGGLMEDHVTKDRQKIPLLGDIPILGWLFKKTNVTKQKNNLLIFITPHVIKDPSDFSNILKNKLNQRNKFIDDNYGKRQARIIRDMIRAHREDLLEYTPPVSKVEVMPEVEIINEETSEHDNSKQSKEEKKPKDLSNQQIRKSEKKNKRGQTKQPPKIEGLDLAY